MIDIIDTGVMTSHTDFGGRASFGIAIAGSPNYDGTGHGIAPSQILTGTIIVII